MDFFFCFGLSYPPYFIAARTLLLRRKAEWHDASVRLKGYNRATMIGHLEIWDPLPMPISSRLALNNPYRRNAAPESLAHYLDNRDLFDIAEGYSFIG